MKAEGTAPKGAGAHGPAEGPPSRGVADPRGTGQLAIPTFRRGRQRCRCGLVPAHSDRHAGRPWVTRLRSLPDERAEPGAEGRAGHGRGPGADDLRATGPSPRSPPSCRGGGDAAGPLPPKPRSSWRRRRRTCGPSCRGRRSMGGRCTRPTRWRASPRNLGDAWVSWGSFPTAGRCSAW